MADDQLKDLFGSDSEEDQPQTKAANGGGDGSAAPVPAEAATRTREAQMKDLFGSDDEEDEGGAAPQAPSAAGATIDYDDYRRESIPPEPALRGPPMHVEVALHDALAPGPLRLAKLSNVLGIESRPFDPETYAPEGTEYIDERGHKRVRLGDNSMRWRWAPGPNGALMRESNARLVRWSDGSVTLAVGEEVFDAREIDVKGDHSYLFARHSNLIQGQGPLQRKLVFRPASLTSGSHKRLAAAVDRQQASTRQQRVRATATLVDPKKEKEDKERAEEARIKDNERLVGRQQRQLRRYSAPSGAPRQRYSALSAAYLEEDEEEEEEDDGFIVKDDEVSGDEGYGSAARRALDEDEEAEAERRLAAAKTAAPPPSSKRRTAPVAAAAAAGGVLEDSEDEDISGDDEAAAEEMKGFIVQEGEEEEEEEAGGRPEPPAKKKRTFMFESDSE